METDNWLVVGKIVGNQGLKGQVRVLSYSDFPERFEVPGKRWLRNSNSLCQTPEIVELISGYPHSSKKNLYVVSFAEITTYDQAERFRNYEVLVPQTDRPHLEVGEFYVADLIGCQVFNQITGALIGEVTAVIPAGNDLLEVTNNEKVSVLVPFVEAIVPEVDLTDRKIAIIPLPGLIDHLTSMEVPET